jgi:hypothetical protein
MARFLMVSSSVLYASKAFISRLRLIDYSFYLPNYCLRFLPCYFGLVGDGCHYGCGYVCIRSGPWCFGVLVAMNL